MTMLAGFELNLAGVVEASDQTANPGQLIRLFRGRDWAYAAASIGIRHGYTCPLLSFT
jgi:hypothetical protein